MTLDILSICIGLFAGLFIAAPVFALFLVKSEKQKAELSAKLNAEEQAMEHMQQAFSLTAQEVLDKNSERFLTLAQEKIKQAQADHAHDIEKKQKAISDLVDPIGKSLKEMEQRVETLGKAGAGLHAQLQTFAEDQKMLRQETQNLVQALRNPAARGRWGEMQLQRALEMIGMVEGTHFVQQQNVAADGSRKQPDFIIKMPGEMQVIIDVKTPIEPYWEALEAAETEAGQQQAVDKFRRKLRDHLKQLSSKEYWRHFDAPEFVVMFLPTEGLYSMAVSNDPALIEEAARNNVILASPTTLMGLLRIVRHGWQQSQMADEAKNIAALGAELYNRLGKFGEHVQKIGRNLGTVINAYNDTVGSLERSVLPGARKLHDMHVQTGGREIPDLAEIDKVPSSVSSPELLQSSKDNEDSETVKKKKTG